MSAPGHDADIESSGSPDVTGDKGDITEDFFHFKIFVVAMLDAIGRLPDMRKMGQNRANDPERHPS
jgi:hypothetical protein